jgi:hypothetical protein
MHHKSHVGLVDTHTEGDRRNDDLNIVSNERFLVSRAGRWVEPGMIWRRFESVVAES